VPGGKGANSLSGFAEAHGLAPSTSSELPTQGTILSQSSGRAEGAAKGSLPGGIEGTVVHWAYDYTVTDSDDHSHTETRRLTLVVTSVPVSIGFVPYLGFSRGASHFVGTAGGTKMRRVDLGKAQGLKHASCFIFAGTDENWQAQVFSPALLDWLARSPEDFGFELANGVLVAGRTGRIGTEGDLTSLCEDTAHLAETIREQAQQAVDTGGAETRGAKDPDADDPKLEKALARVENAPTGHLGEAEADFRRSSRASAGWRALKKAALLTLLLNIPGAALPITFTLEGFYLALALIEAAILLIAFFFLYRSAIRGDGAKLAKEAFFRGYAKSRGLTLEEPLHFMATHADAKVPFKPDRVMTGPLPGGGEGSLLIFGDGTKRADRIAVVGGPAGPLAESELEAEAPGLSTKDLDTYLEQLAGEVGEARQGDPAGEAAAPA
jgi:hypothetical protein